MKSILPKNDVTKKELILPSNFNINRLDFDKNNRVQSFVNLMLRFGMIPTINKPTRVTRHTATEIDRVFTNTITDNIKIRTAIMETDIYDHFPIIFATQNKIDAKIPEQTFSNLIFQTSQSISKAHITQFDSSITKGIRKSSKKKQKLYKKCLKKRTN